MNNKEKANAIGNICADISLVAAVIVNVYLLCELTHGVLHPKLTAVTVVMALWSCYKKGVLK